MPYRVIEIAADSAIRDEQLGSKPKFWFLLGEEWWLFKERRINTGEDWAEKAASEIARAIGYDAATVELASFGNRVGCASKIFVNRSDQGLVHGNEILAAQIEGYDRAKKQHHRDHTFENIITGLQGLLVDEEIWRGVLETLASYLVLDALICNTDRHHENWGLLVNPERTDDQKLVLRLTVAPSFDHASSLGRELTDVGAAKIIKDNRVLHYVRKGHGGIYLRSSDARGANPLHLVEFASRKFPDYFRDALTELKAVPLTTLQATLDEVPPKRISDVRRQFAKMMLASTYPVLVGLAP